MIKIQPKPITLYKYEELSPSAQKSVFRKHKEFLVNTYSDDMFDKSYNMTRKKYIKSLTKEEIIENIKINEYLFFKNGKMANVTHFTGKHERSGETIVEYEGEEYSL